MYFLFDFVIFTFDCFFFRVSWLHKWLVHIVHGLFYCSGELFFSYLLPWNLSIWFHFQMVDQKQANMQQYIKHAESRLQVPTWPQVLQILIWGKCWTCIWTVTEQSQISSFFSTCFYLWHCLRPPLFIVQLCVLQLCFHLSLFSCLQ